MCNISYFNEPISPFRTEDGQLRKATVKPSAEIGIKELFKTITDPMGQLAGLTKQVRSARDYKSAKVRLLPYVTPYGVFSERRNDCLVTYSGLIPLDFDHLDSEAEAEDLRDWIFNDKRLDAKLAFVSPSGKGVKAFIDYGHLLKPGVEVSKPMLNGLLEDALRYVSFSFRRYLGDCADGSGKDLARACLLCHDAGAKYRD